MRSHLLIGVASSGSGKTTFTLRLLRALRNRSSRVQPFKCRSDYIDTCHHKMAAGCTSVNLDGFMVSEGHTKDLYTRYTSNADVAVTEGIIGLLDGYDAIQGNSAGVSGLLWIPIVLVVDAKSTAYPVVPLFYSFRNFRKNLNVMGVVFNFVASESHYSFLGQACEDAGVGVLGYLPKCADVEILSRHLGLSLDEDSCFEEFVDRVICLMGEHVDIDRLSAITALPERQLVPRVKEVMRAVPKANLNIAIARDPAFNFSYGENIHFLSILGRITCFSPLRDDCLPEADFVYLPGEYPELYLSELNMNSGTHELIHSFVEVGGELLVECGGAMCLCKEIIGTDGNAYPMVSVLSQSITVESMKLRSGYWTLCHKGNVLRGHEFHYPRIMPIESPLSPVVKTPTAKRGQTDTPLYRYKNILAGYTHSYWGNLCRNDWFIDYLYGEAPDHSR